MRSGQPPFACRPWAKLTNVAFTESHLIVAATVTRGPSNDSPQFVPAVRQATDLVGLDGLLCDGAYDSEANHRVAREECGVRCTVIPVNFRGHRPPGGPSGRYRRQMHRRFPRRRYGQRWQGESVFSRMKRRLGSTLRARSVAAQERECLLKVLTHNLMLLGAAA
ncbi:MAG: transposase [Planctomycetes bacterium]|nr:transposase [Planctomycetota bacterium]